MERSWEPPPIAQQIRLVGLPPRGAKSRLVGSRAGATLLAVDPSVPRTTPTVEKPALSDAERAKRLKLLAERLRNPDGLDHEALTQVEQLNGSEQ